VNDCGAEHACQCESGQEKHADCRVQLDVCSGGMLSEFFSVRLPKAVCAREVCTAVEPD
jgi:hypothetical protein